MVRDTDGGFPCWIGIQQGWEEREDDPINHLVGVSAEELKTHALLIGSTGSGKTNLLHHLIAQDITRGHSICVLDLRGDLADAVVRLCTDIVPISRIKVLDLRERERPLGFDPLSGPGEPYFRALGVLDALANEAESWGVQLAETLRNGLMLLAEAGGRLTDLDRVFYDRHVRASLVSRIEASPVSEFWQRFDDLSVDRQQALAAPVLNKVSALVSTKTLRTVLGHATPLDLAAQVNTPGSVTLVSLATDELHSAGRMMGNVVLSSLCREVFSRVRVAESSRNPVRLYVDEFEHFLVPDFETILAEGRRFGLSLILAHQTLAQLTPRMRSLVLNNVGVKFAFRCGREDATTLAKDITGDGKSLDLHDLPVGHALMWVRGFGCNVIEVNEPIARARRGDERTRAYVEALREAMGEVPKEAAASHHTRPTTPRLPLHLPAQSAKNVLEDWLHA